MNTLTDEILRRRLCDHFAPGRRQDHLDQKMLLFGGAIQLAGEVKHEGLAFYLLDTPATRISVRRADAIRLFHPFVVYYEAKLLARIAAKRQRSAGSTGRRIASAYALVLGYMSALAAGAPDGAIAG
jgi:hypothetical protein